jgi:hypothetical protein
MKCEFCESEKDVIVFPTGSADHNLCLECAGKIAVEALRFLPMGAVSQ